MLSIMAPLDGITVLDLTRVLSGPYCTMLLADMGARVIKIEQPGKGDDTRAWGPPFLYRHPPDEGESAYFLSINRNKESVTLDFKHPEGRRAARAADRDERRARRELPARHAGEARPRLPDARRAASAARLLLDLRVRPDRSAARRKPGYDAIMQAEGGLMSITGAADGPPYRLGVAIADIVSGMFAAYGIAHGALRARAHRARPGRRPRDARRGRRAAHLSGRATTSRAARCRRASATAIRPSCRTRRSPRRTASSCSRSATTISGAGSARSRSCRRIRASRPTASA